ncbi:unnamed protein product [Amoebophrya sp. A25]|nr:unnamed protein product [Amoebophrya sp. A25]|eukprot:GSA25T00007993001.1
MWVSFERCCDMEIAPDTPGAYRGTSQGVGFNAACHTFFGNANTYERCCISEFILIERKTPLYLGYLDRVKTLREDRRYLKAADYKWFYDTAENKPPEMFAIKQEASLKEIMFPYTENAEDAVAAVGAEGGNNSGNNSSTSSELVEKPLEDQEDGVPGPPPDERLLMPFNLEEDKVVNPFLERPRQIGIPAKILMKNTSSSSMPGAISAPDTEQGTTSSTAVSSVSSTQEQHSTNSLLLLKKLVLGQDLSVPWQTRWLGVEMDLKGKKRRSDQSRRRSTYDDWVERSFPNFFGIKEATTFIREHNMTRRLLLLQTHLQTLRDAWGRWGADPESKSLIEQSGMRTATPKGFFQTSAMVYGWRDEEVDATLGKINPPFALGNQSDAEREKNTNNPISNSGIFTSTQTSAAAASPTSTSSVDTTPSQSTPRGPQKNFASTSVNSRAEEELNIASLQMLLDRGEYKVDRKKQRGGCMNRFGKPVCCDEIEPEVEETASCLNEDFVQEADVAIVTGVFGPGDKNEFTNGAIKMGKSLNVVLGQEEVLQQQRNFDAPAGSSIKRRKRADLVILEINQFPIADEYRVRLRQAGWKICTVACVKNRSFIHQPALRHRFTFTKLKLLSFVQYQRAMWLDSDVQIVGPIDELIDFDFDAPGRDCKMAAVRDVMIDSQNAKQPGIENRHNFNAGLMIVEPSWQQYWHMVTLLGNQHGGRHPPLRKMWWDEARRRKMLKHRQKLEARERENASKKTAGGNKRSIVYPPLSATALSELNQITIVQRDVATRTSGSSPNSAAVETTTSTTTDKTKTSDKTSKTHPPPPPALLTSASLTTVRYERYLLSHPFATTVPDDGEAIFMQAEPPNTLSASPVQGGILNPTTGKRYPVFHNAAMFITHPSVSENGVLELEEAVRYLPDPTFSEQGFWNDNYRHQWCRLPCKYNAILPYMLVPRLRFIWERCSRDARIVHWALFKPHFCPKLEPRYVSLDDSTLVPPPMPVVVKKKVEEIQHQESPGQQQLPLSRKKDATDIAEGATTSDEPVELSRPSSIDELSAAKNPAGFMSHDGEHVNVLLGQNSRHIAPTAENKRFFFDFLEGQDREESKEESTSNTTTISKNKIISPFFPKNVRIFPRQFPRVGFYDYDPEFSLRGYLWNLGNAGIEARLILRLFCFYYHIV